MEISIERLADSSISGIWTRIFCRAQYASQLEHKVKDAWQSSWPLTLYSHNYVAEVYADELKLASEELAMFLQPGVNNAMIVGLIV